MESQNKFSRAVSQAFAAWGKKASGTSGVISIFLALVCAATLSVGVHRIEFYNSIIEIWTADGSQSRSDRALYNHAFGGLSREAALIISASDDDNVLSKSHIDALANASREIPNLKVGAATQKDFCSRPDVPALFRKTPPGQLQFATAATFHSYGFAKITQCLAKQNVFKDPALVGLEDTWGIERFPCSRVSALDCFREGNFDYPEELKQLDSYARPVTLAKIQNKDVFDACGEQLRNEFFTGLNAGAFLLPPEDQEKFKQQMSILTEQIMLSLIGAGGTVDLFSTWGYSYRSEYSSMPAKSVAAYMNGALTNLRNSTFDTRSCFQGQPCCLSWSGLSLDAESAFGDISAGMAKSIRTAYFHRSADDEQWAKTITDLVPEANTSQGRLNALETLEQSIIDKFQPRFEKASGSGFASNESYQDSNFDYYVARSSSDILRDAGNFPIGLVVLGFAIMTIYIVCVLMNYKSPFVYSRLMLGVAAIVILSVGMLVGFGVMGWAGIRLTPLATNVLPFAVLGIGVDDVFLIVFTLLDKAELSKTPIERMGVVMAAVGPSVTLTSLSLIIGFLFSAIVRIPAVYSFAYQLAITIAANYLLLMTIFVPLCAWDSLRISKSRADLAPCVQVDSGQVLSEEEAYQRGTIVAKATGITDKYLSSGLFFKRRACAVFTTITAVLFTIAMLVVSLTQSRRGLELSSIALSGSYQRSFLDIQERAFPLQTSYLVHVAEKDFALDVIQDAAIAQSEEIQKSFGTSDRPALRDVSWLYGNAAALLTQYNAPRGLNLTNPIPLDAFYSEFGTWTFAGAGSSQLENLRCTRPEDETPIKSADFVSCSTPLAINDVLDQNRENEVALRVSRMTFVQRGLVEASDYVKSISETRQVLRDTTTEGLRSFVYGAVYELWDQYVTIYGTLFKVLGLTLLGVSIVAFILLPPLVALMTVLVLVALAVQLVGFSVIIGINFNAVSVTNFAIGVSMGVEFSAHYANAFASHGNDALRRTFPAITAGALSTLLSLLPMIGSRFPFVRLYYFSAWSIMTFLAYLNGAVVLPLSLHLLTGK